MPTGAEPDDAGLALWRLPPMAALESWLDALPPERLPRVRAEVAPDRAAALVLAACREAGHAADDPAGVLAGEAGGLARRFGRLAGLATLDLRLDAIDHDACRRFHRDRVALRLIVTYRGPGTQLVPACRADEALVRQSDYRGPMQTLDRRTVALFRGSARGDTGIVHRSPPVAGRGVTRLVLCLSEPFR